MSHVDLYWDSPYSEARRLSLTAYIPGRGKEVLDRINTTFGHFYKWGRPAPIERVRQKRQRGFYKKNAFKILGDLTGMPYGDVSYYSDWTMAMDTRVDWLLRRIYDIKETKILENGINNETYEFYFLKAIAKDAGVWPAPKWWLVTRRLKSSTRLPTTK